MSQYANYTDYQLFYCCNDFNINAPNITLGSATRQTSRHNFPVISYTPANQLVSYALENVGAFARDPMDRRLMTPLQNNVIATQAINGTDYFNGSFLKDAAETFPTDTDNDGMADVWETANGLSPTVADHNGTQLSNKFTGIEGYTNLECYLNELSDKIVGKKCNLLTQMEQPLLRELK